MNCRTRKYRTSSTKGVLFFGFSRTAVLYLNKIRFLSKTFGSNLTVSIEGNKANLYQLFYSNEIEVWLKSLVLDMVLQLEM